MLREFKCPHCGTTFTLPLTEYVYLIQTHEPLKKECEECNEEFILQFDEEKGMSTSKIAKRKSLLDK